MFCNKGLDRTRAFCHAVCNEPEDSIQKSALQGVYPDNMSYQSEDEDLFLPRHPSLDSGAQDYGLFARSKAIVAGRTIHRTTDADRDLQ